MSKVESNETNETNESNKSVLITGTNNRYLIKRANRVKNEVKKREIMNKYNIMDNYLNYAKQLDMLTEIYYKKNEQVDDREKKIIIQELDKKLKSYKHQDMLKKIYNELVFIDVNTILQRLIDCKLSCYYCNCELYVLYENVRELYQWTIDRVDNSLGHNKDNFVIGCLNCNIKRRKTNKDKFLFTKQLNLIKKG